MGKPFTLASGNYLYFKEWLRTAGSVADSMANAGVRTLNVAGSRGSTMPPEEVRIANKILASLIRHWASNGYHVVPDLSDVHEDEAGEVGSRAGGGCLCPFCHRSFFDHPHDETRLTPGGHKFVSEKVIRKLRRSLISRGLLDPGTRRRHYVGRRVVGPAMPDTEERIAFHTARVERELGGLVAAGKEKPVIRWNNGARKK
jgi:hypothetical protein